MRQKVTAQSTSRPSLKKPSQKVSKKEVSKTEAPEVMEVSEVIEASEVMEASEVTSKASTETAAKGSSSMKEAILRFLMKRGTATAAAIAHHLDITPQGIRRHLKNLESDGLIAHQTSQEGMGRPNHVYQLSRRGREQFPDQYDQFALSLLNTVADTLGPEHVGKLLKHQWQSKAKEYREQLGDAPLKERMQTLVKLRQAEGYMAECYPADEAAGLEGAAFVITEYNCAIAHIAESYPTVCGHELAMFAIALPDCSVERTHWLVNGEHQCGYLVKTKKANA